MKGVGFLFCFVFSTMAAKTRMFTLTGLSEVGKGTESHLPEQLYVCSVRKGKAKAI